MSKIFFILRHHSQVLHSTSRGNQRVDHMDRASSCLSICANFSRDSRLHFIDRQKIFTKSGQQFFNNFIQSFFAIRFFGQAFDAKLEFVNGQY